MMLEIKGLSLQYLDCEISSAGFLFNRVEFGALACIIAASGFAPLRSPSDCGPGGITPSAYAKGLTLYPASEGPWSGGKDGILERALEEPDR